VSAADVYNCFLLSITHRGYVARSAIMDPRDPEMASTPASPRKAAALCLSGGEVEERSLFESMVSVGLGEFGVEASISHLMTHASSIV